MGKENQAEEFLFLLPEYVGSRGKIFQWQEGNGSWSMDVHVEKGIKVFLTFLHLSRFEEKYEC